MRREAIETVYGADGKRANLGVEAAARTLRASCSWSHLLVAIEKTLLDRGVHTSWASVRDALATHHIVTIVLPTYSGATMRIRKASTAESEHRELYRLLGVDEKFMSPNTFWSETGDHE